MQWAEAEISQDDEGTTFLLEAVDREEAITKVVYLVGATSEEAAQFWTVQPREDD